MAPGWWSALGAGIVAFAWPLAAIAQAPPQMPTAAGASVTTYEEGWANIQAQDAARPKAVQPAQRDGEAPRPILPATPLGVQEAPIRQRSGTRP
jgi:hypothetical protein